jgi:hypothetical protein
LVSPIRHTVAQSPDGAIFRIRNRGDLRFNMSVQTVDRLVAALRRCCQSLPDQCVELNTTYTIADFALAAFAPFFMQRPSFSAHLSVSLASAQLNETLERFQADRNGQRAPAYRFHEQLYQPTVSSQADVALDQRHINAQDQGVIAVAPRRLRQELLEIATELEKRHRLNVERLGPAPG